MSFVTQCHLLCKRYPILSTTSTVNFPNAAARRSGQHWVPYLEEPVLVEGEADGRGVVEGDEGGSLEDEAAGGAGLRAAAAGPPASTLLLDNTHSF